MFIKRLTDSSLKRVPGGSRAEPPLGALAGYDLLDLFAAALAQPEIAKLLPDYISRHRDFWDIQRDRCPQLWVPAHAEFALALPRAEELVDQVRSRTLTYVTLDERLVRPEAPEYQQALTLMLLRAGPLTLLRRYVARMKSTSFQRSLKDCGDAASGPGKSLNDIFENELYGIILLAVVNDEETANLATTRFQMAVSRSSPPHNLLYGHDGPYLWGMVHSILKLDIPYQRHRAYIEAGEFGDPLLGEELALPDVGGEAYADLNRRCCHEVTKWFQHQPVVKEPVRDLNPPRERSAEIAYMETLGFFPLRTLAEKHNLPPDRFAAFVKRVTRFVAAQLHPEVIRSRVRARRPREPQYLFSENHIHHIIQDMLCGR